MRALSCAELSQVSGAQITTETWDYMDKLTSNILDGMSTGMSIGGTWAGAGGFLFGAISQLVGIIVPTVMGGILGFTAGIILGYEETNALLADYRDKFGAGSQN